MKFGSSAPFLSGALVILLALILNLQVTKSAPQSKVERVAR